MHCDLSKINNQTWLQPRLLLTPRNTHIASCSVWLQPYTDHASMNLPDNYPSDWWVDNVTGPRHGLLRDVVVKTVRKKKSKRLADVIIHFNKKLITSTTIKYIFG